MGDPQPEDEDLDWEIKGVKKYWSGKSEEIIKIKFRRKHPKRWQKIRLISVER